MTDNTRLYIRDLRELAYRHAQFHVSFDEPAWEAGWVAARFADTKPLFSDDQPFPLLEWEDDGGMIPPFPIRPRR